MARLPDLVRDSELNIEFRDGFTVHLSVESGRNSQQRDVWVEETWKLEQQVGGGASGTIWREACVKGRSQGELREVKKVPLRGGSVKDVQYLRELEAIIKFSHRKVRFTIKSVKTFLKRSLGMPV